MGITGLYFLHVPFFTPDYRNVIAKYNKLENFSLFFYCSILPPPSSLSLSYMYNILLSQWKYDVAKVLSFSQASLRRAQQFSFESGTSGRIIFPFNITKYAGNEEVTSLRAFPGSLINSTSFYQSALRLFCTY